MTDKISFCLFINSTSFKIDYIIPLFFGKLNRKIEKVGKNTV